MEKINNSKYVAPCLKYRDLVNCELLCQSGGAPQGVNIASYSEVGEATGNDF